MNEKAVIGGVYACEIMPISSAPSPDDEHFFLLIGFYEKYPAARMIVLSSSVYREGATIITPIRGTYFEYRRFA